MIAETGSVPRARLVRMRSRAAACDLLQPLPVQTLSHEYWTFLRASLFVDFGFGLYFFLFNLYLSSLSFNERTIGLLTSAFTVGSLLGTYPAGLFARRYGLRPLLAVCLLGAPVAACIRLFIFAPTWMLVTSFLFGVCMCGWAVCVPTALARLTNDHNRSVGFSLNFAVGIGAGIVTGFIGGHLPSILMQGLSLSAQSDGMRWTLLFAALLVCIGALPLRQRHFLAARAPAADVHPIRLPGRSGFLVRFLIAYAVWSAVIGAVAPFTSLYMIRSLHVPLERVGTVFSLSQAAQMSAILLVPLVFRRFGSLHIIALTQLGTAIVLLMLSRVHSTDAAIPLLIGLTAGLYLAGPTIYGLLMTHVPDASRSLASAAQSITSSLISAAAAAGAGMLIARHGYSMLFALAAGTACAAAVLLIFLVRPGAEAV